VRDALRCPVIAQAVRQSLADPEARVDLAQQQDAAVGRQPAAPSKAATTGYRKGMTNRGGILYCSTWRVRLGARAETV
jgi:hypothetical protein